MNYKTVDKDYTGCDPVIAEVLKNNKMILCEVRYGDNTPICKRLVIAFIPSSYLPYIATKEGDRNIARYQYAKPIPIQKRFKPAHEIVKWCIDRGWRPGYIIDSLFVDPATDQYLSVNIVRFYGGKIYKPEQLSNTFVHEEWLEDAE